MSGMNCIAASGALSMTPTRNSPTAPSVLHFYLDYLTGVGIFSHMSGLAFETAVFPPVKANLKDHLIQIVLSLLPTAENNSVVPSFSLSFRHILCGEYKIEVMGVWISLWNFPGTYTQKGLD